jgi:hypothetical protein
LHRRTWSRLLWNIVAAISIVSFFRIFCCVFHGFAPSFLSIQYLRYRWPVQCRFYLEPILDRLAPGYLVLIPLRSVSWLDKQCLKHCIHIQKKRYVYIAHSELWKQTSWLRITFTIIYTSYFNSNWEGALLFSPLHQPTNVKMTSRDIHAQWVPHKLAIPKFDI